MDDPLLFPSKVHTSRIVVKGNERTKASFFEAEFAEAAASVTNLPDLYRNIVYVNPAMPTASN
jgi:hypothetical protein